jgi:hypothetical protein
MGKSLTGKIFWWSNTLLIQGAILVNRLIFWSFKLNYVNA